jgi:two-component system sensor histidine kinase/response regulator
VLAKITETAARVLEVDRASLWLYSEDRSRICCRDLYERGADLHSDGPEIAAASYPRYFAALAESRSVAANEARTDPRTAELSHSYLEPIGIQAVLNAPVWLAGRTVGVLCLEHVGSSRSWEVDEEYFAASLANIVSLALNLTHPSRA